jgi:hypothetical protein
MAAGRAIGHDPYSVIACIQPRGELNRRPSAYLGAAQRLRDDRWSEPREVSRLIQEMLKSVYPDPGPLNRPWLRCPCIYQRTICIRSRESSVLGSEHHTLPYRLRLQRRLRRN